MRLFVWNSCLALVWAFAIGDVSALNLGVGFTLGLVILNAVRTGMGKSVYGRSVWFAATLFVYLVWELLLANMRVARDVLTPHLRMRPGIIAVPLDARSPLQITVLANLISLTPGMLSLGLSEDGRTLFVHTMFVGDADKERRLIKAGFERRVLKVFP
ncbi:MAG: Na+/H+ antiporter subunit E [Planctomycetales bacterium]|nr:Na+/H+ antiporter subunit E [Planctomycetales bacterium]